MLLQHFALHCLVHAHKPLERNHSHWSAMSGLCQAAKRRVAQRRIGSLIGISATPRASHETTPQRVVRRTGIGTV